MGLAVLPHYLARRYDLVRVEAPHAPSRDLWVAVHEDTRHTPRIRALTDALAKGLQERAGLLCVSA
jgi:DNA-binding transcriptional LysR family regulator